MKGSTLKHKVVGGLFWQYFQRIGAQAVSFIVSIILARLLTPDDFGTIALIGVFITICNIFIDSGFGNALIQRKSIDEIDTSSVFYTNLGVSLILYIGLFFLSPLIASFYEDAELCPLLRVLSLQLIAMALSCVQNAILVREMKFKLNFYISISSVIASSAVGLTCAYSGYGVWSLVYSQLTMQIANAAGYWILVGWRPKAVFSVERVKGLFDYGSKILAGSMLNVIYNNIYNLVIGKRYSAVELGFYNRGQIIPTLLVENAANTINGVMFPALSKIQDDRAKFLEVVRKMVSVVAFIVFLLMGILLPLSTPLIKVLLTNRWLSCVPFMQIVCITVCFTPFILINSAILTALGKSGKYLKGVTLSKILSILIILAASFINVYIMVASGIVAAIISVFIMSHWNNALIGYNRKMMCQDIIPSMFLSIVVGLSVFGLTQINLNDIITVLLGAFIGTGIYIGLAYALHFRQITFLKEVLRK